VCDAGRLASTAGTGPWAPGRGARSAGHRTEPGGRPVCLSQPRWVRCGPPASDRL